MLLLLYVIPAILCLWGGCLIARLVANRLELGVFRRKRRAATAVTPTTTRRSLWWGLVGFGSLVCGGFVAFFAHAILNDASSSLDISGNLSAENVLVSAVFMAAGLSAGLGIIGWRFDPALGRRRCPKCWYDLSGAVAAGPAGRRCPECGHEAASEKLLFRTRRSRATLAIAVLPLVLAPLSFRAMEARRVGWRGWIPTTAMVLAWEYMSDDLVGYNFESGSLKERLDEDDVWQWQAYLLCVRCERAMRRASEAQRITLAADLFDDAERSLDGNYADDPWLMQRAIGSRLKFLAGRLNQSNVAERTQAGEALSKLYMALDSDSYEAQFRSFSGLSREELLALAMPLLDSEFTEAREHGLGLLVFLQHVPAPEMINQLESLLLDPAVTWWQCHAILSILEKAPQRERVREVFSKAVSTHNGAVRANILRSVGGLRDDPIIYAALVETIRNGDATLVKAATAPLSRLPGKEREVLALVVERLERNPSEATHLLYPIVTHFEPELPLTRDLYSRALPLLLPLLENGASSDAAQVAWLLSDLRAATPEVRAAMQNCLRRLDLATDDRARVASAWGSLFEAEPLPTPLPVTPPN